MRSVRCSGPWHAATGCARRGRWLPLRSLPFDTSILLFIFAVGEAVRA